MSETGPCEQCRTEIDADATRCPECGYEPGGGAVVKLLTAIAYPVFAISALLAVVTLLMVFSSLGLASVVVGTIVFGGVAAGSGYVLWASSKQDEVTATDSTIDSSLF